MNNEFSKYLNKYIKQHYTNQNIEEGLFFVVGVLANIVLTQEYYKRNADLKEFTTDILYANYKEYLFKSRTSLYTRVVKDIIRANDQTFVIEVVNNIVSFIFTRQKGNINEKIENNKKDSKKIVNDIKAWVDVIESKDKS